jgi:hypothetical protein
MDIITCISGWWSVGNKFKGGANAQIQHMKKTLLLKSDFIFFYSDDEIKKKVSEIRKDLNTKFIKYNIDDFSTYKFSPNMRTKIHYGCGWCPSKELWLLWMEKINLCLKAIEECDIKSDWICWYDATLCKYRIGRQNLPNDIWPNVEKMKLLDKNKINCSVKKDNKMNKGEWPPLVTATAFIMHKDFVPKYAKIFYELVDELFENVNNGTHKIVGSDQFNEQYPLTYLYHLRPELYNPIAEGFGSCVEVLK